MTIQDNLQAINKAIHATALACDRDPSTIQLLAVSKHHPISSIQEAIDAGQKSFGENYIQEAEIKCKALHQDASFHFIGHVQSNKAKVAASLFDVVETVDRFKLAKALHKQLEKENKQLDILVQVNIANDPNKHGVAPHDTITLLKEITALPTLKPMGLMTMPPYSQDLEQTRAHFKALRDLSKTCAEKGLFYNNEAVQLSMGMSHDFKVAIEEGSTCIRVGTAIFGARIAN